MDWAMPVLGVEAIIGHENAFEFLVNNGLWEHSWMLLNECIGFTEGAD